MFTKQLKYDFMFSYKTFFTMFAGIIALSLVVRVADILPDMPEMLSDILRMIVIGAGGTAVAVASYIQILLFYQRSFFGPEGYLTLTLPLSRSRQLASKLITTFVWFIFMVIAVPIMLLILAPPHRGLVGCHMEHHKRSTCCNSYCKHLFTCNRYDWYAFPRHHPSQQRNLQQENPRYYCGLRYRCAAHPVFLGLFGYQQ